MSDYSRLLGILQRLIAFKTVVHDQAAIQECFAYIESLLSECKLSVHRYSSNGYASMVISTTGHKHSKVLLQAHIDVVPGYDHQFVLEQREGKLYGRGTYDMKFAAAAYLELLLTLQDTLPDYDLSVMFTSDEEDDGHNGVEYLLNQGYSTESCILPDSGADWNIEASAKGFSTARIVKKGRSAHGSRPWEAENAAESLMELSQAIMAEFPVNNPLGNTVTLTVISAGEAYNQIPGDAVAVFDIRYTDEDAMKDIAIRLRRLCRKFSADMELVGRAAALAHDTNHGSFESWQTFTAQVTGTAPNFIHSFGASDARYLVPRGIPTIMTRPRGGGAHSGEEWISEKGLYDFYEILKLFVAENARSTIDSPTS